MKMENRCGLSTCANTKVCSKPVTSAAPAVVVRSRKNGMEIRRCFILRGLPLAERQTIIEQRARRRFPGEAIGTGAAGFYQPLAQGRVGGERPHMAHDRV